jgi:light-regulated signal transduction histidine kinase (bacteriophytochrome)
MVVQLFQNLIRNSIRYRDDAVPTIHISAVRVGERWQFQVRDNGIGIDQGRRGTGIRPVQIFGRSRPHRIALALCRKVVERDGGRMWVKSEAGHGAAFGFTIPTCLDSVLPEFSAFGPLI